MDIKSLNSNNINVYTRPITNNNQQEAANAVQAKGNNVSDKLEISQKARELQKQEATSLDFKKIRSQIDSGYYNTPEVSLQVADKMYSDIFK